MPFDISRRQAMALALGGVACASGLLPGLSKAAERTPLMRVIPSTGEKIPAVGMGTWRTFNVGHDPQLRENRKKILKTFFDYGGAMIDSSPMYGSSEEVIGWCYDRLDRPEGLFSATKVWTRGKEDGISEMETSRRLWGIPRFDVMQIHNLLDWEVHLETLKKMKAQGQIRYLGITTSHGRDHQEFEHIMTHHDLDFIQLTYNVLDRDAERRLLPLAQERNIAVIANRPFRMKALFHYVGNAPLPDWVSELGIQNWAQYFLKFILSHPAITCAIPATSQVAHMHENMNAAFGPLPDASLRMRMSEYVENL